MKERMGGAPSSHSPLMIGADVEKVMKRETGMDQRNYELPDEAEQKDHMYTNCSYRGATLLDEGKRIMLTYDVSPAPYLGL